MYCKKTINDIGGIERDLVICVEDSVAWFISEESPRWQDYEAWLEDGNTPEPYNPESEPPLV